MIETERKFIVSLTLGALCARETLYRRDRIEQRYLPNTGEWVTRVRKVIITGKDYPEYYLTMKKRIDDLNSHEMESRIDERAYKDIAAHCAPEVLIKNRHHFEHMKRLWTVDEFVDPIFDGLLLAEVEFNAGDEIEIPDWVDADVTHDPQYRNFRLVERLRSR